MKFRGQIQVKLQLVVEFAAFNPKEVLSHHCFTGTGFSQGQAELLACWFLQPNPFTWGFLQLSSQLLCPNCHLLTIYLHLSTGVCRLLVSLCYKAGYSLCSYSSDLSERARVFAGSLCILKYILCAWKNDFAYSDINMELQKQTQLAQCCYFKQNLMGK